MRHPPLRFAAGLALGVAALAAAGCGPGTWWWRQVTPVPVQFEYQRERVDRPPLYNFQAKMVLTNPLDEPVWVVWPRNLGRPVVMPAGRARFTWSVLTAGPFGAEPLGAAFYTEVGGTGEAVMLDILRFEEPDSAMRLMRLAPRARVEFESLPFEGWEGLPQRFQVWLASEILVNDRVPLQDWLPYRTESSAEVRIAPLMGSAYDSKNLNWDPDALKLRADLRTDARSLELRLLGSWEVTVNGLPAAAPGAAGTAPVSGSPPSRQ